MREWFRVFLALVCNLFTEIISLVKLFLHYFHNVLRVAISFGKDEHLRHFKFPFGIEPVGKITGSRFFTSLDDGAYGTGVDDVFIELFTGIFDIFIHRFPKIFTGEAFALIYFFAHFYE